MRRTLSLFILAGLCLLIQFSSIAQEKEEIFMVVEEMPLPPGGMEAFYQDLAQEIKYPVKARKAGIEGRVFVQFVVDNDGALKKFNVLKGVSPEIDAEALRALKAASPKWAPGKQRGRNVRVLMSMPIMFKLSNAQVSNQKDKPLIVLDGEVQSQLVDSKELLKDLKPESIKNVEVMKGEKAIKIYGENAKDGVIIITTKQAKLEEEEEILIESEIIIEDQKEIVLEIETEEVSPTIKIRSQARLDDGNPLYILDGVKYKGELGEINPNNIKKIEVIKGTPALQKFGKEAKNGVVIITTKKKVKEEEVIEEEVEVEMLEEEGTNDLVMVLEEDDQILIRDGVFKNPLVILDGVVLGNKQDNEDFIIKINPDNIKSV
ncbi:MAG: TonB family protein, partial [Bacteroidota bacterium]